MSRSRRLGERDAAALALASTATLAQRCDRLADALARRDEELGHLRGSLHAAWTRIERLERRAAMRALPPRPDLSHAVTSPAPTPRPEGEVVRVPAVTAARRLGLAPATVRRMVAAGQLEGLAIDSGGRRLWTVSLSSVERLERGAQGAPDAENRASAGRAARNTEG